MISSYRFSSLKNTFLLSSVLLPFIVSFFMSGHNAYEWPAIDMAPFWIKLSDNSLLKNDFFTNASISANPRNLFGYSTYYVFKLFHLDWYTGCFYLKTLLLSTTPVLLLLYIIYLIRNWFEKISVPNCVFIFLCISLLASYRFNGLFSIAWWRPLVIQTTPSMFSLWFSLLAVLSFSANKFAKGTAFILFLISSLLHPAVALFFLFFNTAATLNYKNKSKIINQLMAVSTGYVVLSLLYGSASTLDVSEFIKIYIFEAHPHHYSFLKFGTLSHSHWTVTLICINALALFPFIKIKNNLIKLNLALLILCFNAFIFAQFFFINIFPIKAIAILGPSRFAMFGYYIIILSWAAVIQTQSKREIRLDFDYRLLILILLIVNTFLVTFKDNPQKLFTEKNPELYSFITGTDKNSIFLVCVDNLQIDIPVLAKRAVVIGNGFPFSEKFFEEWHLRYKTFYGEASLLNKWPGKDMNEKRDIFFHKQPPYYFYTKAKEIPFDYVIFKKNKVSTLWKTERHIFEDKNYVIYSVKNY